MSHTSFIHNFGRKKITFGFRFGFNAYSNIYKIVVKIKIENELTAFVGK